MKGSDMIDSPARRALLGLGLAGGLSGLGMARALAADRPPGSDMRFASSRPPPGQRRFVSPAVDAAIADLQRRIGDPELAWMFDNCLPNTLDTTVTEGTVDGKQAVSGILLLDQFRHADRYDIYEAADPISRREYLTTFKKLYPPTA